MTTSASYVELTKKHSVGCYKISSYGKRADFSEEGLKRVIFA